VGGGTGVMFGEGTGNKAPAVTQKGSEEREWGGVPKHEHGGRGQREPGVFTLGKRGGPRGGGTEDRRSYLQ